MCNSDMMVHVPSGEVKSGDDDDREREGEGGKGRHHAAILARYTLQFFMQVHVIPSLCAVMKEW